jgi:hypothetical protein
METCSYKKSFCYPVMLQWFVFKKPVPISESQVGHTFTDHTFTDHTFTDRTFTDHTFTGHTFTDHTVATIRPYTITIKYMRHTPCAARGGSHYLYAKPWVNMYIYARLSLCMYVEPRVLESQGIRDG